MFADDTQLCKSLSPKDDDSLVLSLQKCTADANDYAWEQTNAKLYFKNKIKQKAINSLVPHLALLIPSQTPSLSALETFSLHRQ